MEQDTMVQVDHKDFIGIGQIVFDSKTEWNIPRLHFMVDKTASGNYEATLLEFGLVAWSETEDGAIKSLIKQTYSYILAVIERAGFDLLIQDVDNNVMDGYWRRYRKIVFFLVRDQITLDVSADTAFYSGRAIKYAGFTAPSYKGALSKTRIGLSTSGSSIVTVNSILRSLKIV